MTCNISDTDLAGNLFILIEKNEGYCDFDMFILFKKDDRRAVFFYPASLNFYEGRWYVAKPGETPLLTSKEHINVDADSVQLSYAFEKISFGFLERAGFVGELSNSNHPKQRRFLAKANNKQLSYYNSQMALYNERLQKTEAEEKAKKEAEKRRNQEAEREARAKKEAIEEEVRRKREAVEAEARREQEAVESEKRRKREAAERAKAEERRKIEEAEREAREAREREAAFWASPEGQKVRAAQMLADIERQRALDQASIRLREQEELAKISRQIREEERESQNALIEQVKNL